jgi:protein-tyrosine phosphatase
MKEIEPLGITHIVDCVSKGEYIFRNIPEYSLPTNTTRIHFPIEDMGIEDDSNVLEFIEELLELLYSNPESKIYIHCYGGHGRSATIAGILYGKLIGISHNHVIDIVRKSHLERKTLRREWRYNGAISSETQVKQVERLLK